MPYDVAGGWPATTGYVPVENPDAGLRNMASLDQETLKTSAALNTKHGGAATAIAEKNKRKQKTYRIKQAAKKKQAERVAAVARHFSAEKYFRARRAQILWGIQVLAPKK